MSSSVQSATGRSVSPSRTVSAGGFTHLNTPYALDFYLEDYEDTNSMDFEGDTICSFEQESVGYRTGGPKEARLRKVALLGAAKEVDHLFPIRLKIARNEKVLLIKEKLDKVLAKYKTVEDIYIPEIVHRGKSASNFAVVRFSDEEEANEAFHELQKNYDIETEFVEKQKIIFSSNSGATGICNEPYDDGSTKTGIVKIEQDIDLDDCMARNGAPWTSCRELKYLAPYGGTESVQYFGLKITNIPPHIKADDIKQRLSCYGVIIDARCPKPLQVSLRVKDPNVDIAIVRFKYKDNLDHALEDIKQQKIEFDGMVCKATILYPHYWGNNATRRYY